MYGNIKLTSARYHFYLFSAEMLQFLSQMRHRFTNIIKRQTRTDSDAGWVCRSRRDRERLETLHRHKDTIKTPAKDTKTFDRKHNLFPSYRPLSCLSDLCYLEEMDVMVCVWKLLQLIVSPPQIINLLLQLLQLSFSSTHCSLFLISDQLCHLRAASLNGADQLSKDPLTVLHCCLCRALLGHTERDTLESALTGPSHSLFPTVGFSGTGKSSSTGSSLTDWGES